ncbi:MAG: hypothetical protein Q4P13_05985 [Psychrobacter sp.]|nr:hypothetical protein [Psychrobacter sp.]
MIESKTLGAAVGVQRQDVIDRSESISLPSLSNGVIVGRFKRGRLDQPFKVTLNNYKALLGYDPSNPSYLAVEDALRQGVSEVWVRRVGSSSVGKSSNGDPMTPRATMYTFTDTMFTPDVFESEYIEESDPFIWGNYAFKFIFETDSKRHEIIVARQAVFRSNIFDNSSSQGSLQGFISELIYSNVQLFDELMTRFIFGFMVNRFWAGQTPIQEISMSGMDRYNIEWYQHARQRQTMTYEISRHSFIDSISKLTITRASQAEIDKEMVGAGAQAGVRYKQYVDIENNGNDIVLTSQLKSIPDFTNGIEFPPVKFK